MTPTAKYHKRRYIRRALKSAGLKTLIRLTGEIKVKVLIDPANLN